MPSTVAVSTWLTKSKSCIYYSAPKAGSSLIGQLLFYSESGKYFPGSIHYAFDAFYSFGHDSDIIFEALISRQPFAFTTVRNPYTRLIATFIDKILTPDATGHFYRGLGPKLGIQPRAAIKHPSALRAAFRRFLIFIEGTIKHSWPIPPDPHWNPLALHLCPLAHCGWPLDAVVHLEKPQPLLQQVFDGLATPYHVSVANAPRFNESHVADLPLPKNEPQQWYDSHTTALVGDLYKDDFASFHYEPFRPHDPRPLAPIQCRLLLPMLDALYQRINATVPH